MAREGEGQGRFFRKESESTTLKDARNRSKDTSIPRLAKCQTREKLRHIPSKANSCNSFHGFHSRHEGMRGERINNTMIRLDLAFIAQAVTITARA